MFNDEAGRHWMRYATVGTEFGLTFILMLGLGYWLDVRDGQSLPAYMLTCGALGFALAMYRLVRKAQEIRRQDALDKNKGHHAAEPERRAEDSDASRRTDT